MALHVVVAVLQPAPTKTIGVRCTFLCRVRFVQRLHWSSSSHFRLNDHYFLSTCNRGVIRLKAVYLCIYSRERFTALCLFPHSGHVIGLEKEYRILDIGPQDRSLVPAPPSSAYMTPYLPGQVFRQ